ncbi:MAG TPA: S8/S53 family peptidase [Ignavibacteria bacterium]|jgi:hypothetical protein
MKRYITLLILLVIIAVVAISFKPTGGKFGPHLTAVLDNTSEQTFVVYIYFSDKGANAYALLNNPNSLVTQRSIERRLKVKSQNEVVDFSDIPIYQPYVDLLEGKVLKLRHQVKWFNSVSAEVSREQLAGITELNCVAQIELVEKFNKRRDDVEFTAQDNISEQVPQKDLVDTLNYGTGLTQVSQIKVNLVHNQGIYGQGVLIASLDDGFRNQTHPAFNTQPYPMVIESQYDFQLNLPGAFRTTASHGTTTISCIGAYAPGQLIGTSFKSHFLAARTEVDSFERPIEMDNWVAASQWADSLGADVISSSLGYLDFDPGYPSWTWQDMNGNTLVVTNGADLASDHGIVVVNSAGNNGPNSQHNTLGAPADGDSVITLGAVTSTGTVASFSSVGPTTDNPPRIKPDVMAMGSGVKTANGSGTGYSSFSSGTSYSCPLAAGVCGLILSANKNLTPFQVRGILRKFASMSNNPNNTYGWGIIDAQQSVDSARKLDNTPPTILHTQPFTSTTNNGIIIMKARIYDNGIIRNWTNEAPLLYYRKSINGGINWSSYTAVNYTSTNLDTFFFPITGSNNGTTVEYYFAAQDIALPTPKMATLPAGGSGINPPGQTPPPTRFSYYVGLVGIVPVSNEIPKVFKLYENYPNPFNPTTKIKFDLPKTGITKLAVYDILGREVASLVNEELKAGKYEINFNAGNFSSGVYFYKIIAGEFVDTKKMLLVK